MTLMTLNEFSNIMKTSIFQFLSLFPALMIFFVNLLNLPQVKIEGETILVPK
jgi:hypothetical protein